GGRVDVAGDVEEDVAAVGDGELAGLADADGRGGPDPDDPGLELGDDGGVVGALLEPRGGSAHVASLAVRDRDSVGVTVPAGWGRRARTHPVERHQAAGLRQCTRWFTPMRSRHGRCQSEVAGAPDVRQESGSTWTSDETRTTTVGRRAGDRRPGRLSGSRPGCSPRS